MRLSDCRWLITMALGASGCVVPLDHEFDDDAASPSTDDGGADDAPAVAAGCEVLGGTAGVTTLAGDARSLGLADGGAIWIVDQATTPDGGLALPAAFVVGSERADAGCGGGSATFAGSAVAPSPLAPNGLIAPLDLVATSAGPALYYQLFASDPTQPLGLRALGVGLAPRDPTTGMFVPTSELLWSADRPTYGGSALSVGGTVFVWGCTSSGAFTSDCFVAKASDAEVASTAGYSYWTGDDWSSSADDAAPVTQGGGVVSVRPDATRAGRWLMTYVPPLGNTLVIRSAIAPEGPWSAPVTLASCALDGAGPGAFCGGGEQHAELATTGSATLALTYDAQTFVTDAGSPLDARAFWPQLVTLPIPPSLP